MSLSELTHASILKAVAEFDEIGQDSFLKKYGFGESRSYRLRIGERVYDSKAICGAAHGYAFPAEGPLKAGDFSGGEATVQRVLESLGFEVEVVTREGKVWLVTAFGDDRQYAGNIGYQDDIERTYRYDNFVPNHKQVRRGDLLVLRDRSSMLGIAKILEIEQSDGIKRQLLCPKCSMSGIKGRATKQPLFRCHYCGTEFDAPLIRETTVTNFVAHFEGAFVHARVKADAKQFRPACPKYNGQLAMQEIELDKLGVLGAPVQAAAVRALGLNPEELLAAAAGQPTADEDELRRRVVKLRKTGRIKKPDGQAKPRQVVRGVQKCYERDPKVVAWILDNAKGVCEACSQPGPFEGDQGLPFLEVHHVVYLSEGGPDTTENAAALCPNCHRAMHLARNRAERRELLKQAVARRR